MSSKSQFDSPSRRRFSHRSECAPSTSVRPDAGLGMVASAGIDTWSLCWYGEPGSPLHSAMRGLATAQAGRALLVPERIQGHRIGWFPDHGLVFAEGRLGSEGLCRSSDIAFQATALIEELRNLGVSVDGLGDARVRRLDVAVDLWTDSSVKGLALLECLGSATLGTGKVVTYRERRGVQSVILKSKAGRSKARIYDKGVESDAADRGRWIRFEAQWRFGGDHRLAPVDLVGEELRERFQLRFKGLWEAVGGFEVGGVDAVAARLGEAVKAGSLHPSRARSVAGYLLLGSVGVPQGARRTTCQLERECRELGLSLSFLDPARSERVDAAVVLERCMASEMW